MLSNYPNSGIFFKIQDSLEYHPKSVREEVMKLDYLILIDCYTIKISKEKFSFRPQCGMVFKHQECLE